MWQLFSLSVVQALLLAVGQLTLKLALNKMEPFGWTAHFWGTLLTNWWFIICGVLFGAASLLWMYILKHYPLSMAYPLASMGYAIGLIFAAAFLHESISWNRWLGIVLIMGGCALVTSR